MRERDLLAWVTAAARALGWQVWHVPAPMRAGRAGWVGAREGAGLPDLVLASRDPPRLVFAELKAGRGRLTARQREFLGAVAAVAEVAVDGAEVRAGVPARARRAVGAYVWTPEQRGEIEALLRTRVLT